MRSTTSIAFRVSPPDSIVSVELEPVAANHQVSEKRIVPKGAQASAGHRTLPGVGGSATSEGGGMQRAIAIVGRVDTGTSALRAPATTDKRVAQMKKKAESRRQLEE